MYQYACKARVDVVFISEPYRQQIYWYNDDKGDASLGVTLFRGKQPDETTLVVKNGLVRISMGNVFCIEEGGGGRYCSPNVNVGQFENYVQEFEYMIRTTKGNHPTKVIVNDFNGATTWEALICRKDDDNVSYFPVFDMSTTLAIFFTSRRYLPRVVHRV
jgi:hypothetical protein